MGVISEAYQVSCQFGLEFAEDVRTRYWVASADMLQIAVIYLNWALFSSCSNVKTQNENNPIVINRTWLFLSLISWSSLKQLSMISVLNIFFDLEVVGKC